MEEVEENLEEVETEVYGCRLMLAQVGPGISTGCMFAGQCLLVTVCRLGLLAEDSSVLIRYGMVYEKFRNICRRMPD